MPARTKWYLFWVFMAGCVAMACQGQSPAEYRAAWLMIAQSVKGNSPEPSPNPTPTPEPDSDICENCNGRGRVGDGTVSTICPVCDGTGKKKKAGPMMGQRRLVVWSMDGCGPCQMLRPTAIDLRRAGWDVEFRQSTGGPVPRTDVWVDGRMHTIIGYAGRSSYLQTLKQEALKLRDGR